MEACSLFQDLTFSIEIAAHDAGLEHYAPRVYFDAINVIQRYHECFVLEDWTPPFNARAEIGFEFSSLDTARAQLSDRGIIRVINPAPDEQEPEEKANLGPLTVNLGINFILSLNLLGPPSEKWNDYCHDVTERERLGAGLKTLQHQLQQAMGGETAPTVRVEAHTTLSSAGRLILDTLIAHWPVSIEADVEDNLRQAVLEKLMKRVRAGLERLGDFAQDIIQDFAQR